MLDIKEITLHEAVIHVLDKNGDEPVLNEFLIELEDKDVNEYITKHIKKALKDELIMTAAFRDDSIPKALSESYFGEAIDMLETSKEAARNLFNIIKLDENAESGDLLTVSATTEQGPLLALLSMNYVKSFFHSINYVEDKVGIGIVSQRIGLPGSSQKISKGAFIMPNTGQLYVLDKEYSKIGEGYFVDSFLKCDIVTNDRDQTKKLYQSVEDWTRANLPDNADKAEEIRRESKRQLEHREELELERFSENLFKGHKELQEDFVEFAQGCGVEPEVTLDKQWVDKKLKRTRLKIDNEIDLYLNKEVYDDNDKFEIVRNGDGTINIVIKAITNFIEK